MTQTGLANRTYAALMKPMTAAERAIIEVRLDELMNQIRDLAQRLDAVTAVLPAIPV